jgi:hypothetical protein
MEIKRRVDMQDLRMKNEELRMGKTGHASVLFFNLHS